MDMDSPLSAIDNDEVIADSEEEVEMDSFHGGLGAQKLVSSVSAFTATNHMYIADGDSSISAFTAGPSNINQASGRQKVADISAYNDSQYNESGIASIADRAKTRQRNQTQKRNTDILELTSDDDDDELSLKPLKTQSKSKPTPKPKPKVTKLVDKSAINPSTTTSSSDGIVKATSSGADKPQVRPRPRPNPKRARTTLDSDPLPPHPYPFALNPPLYAVGGPRASSPPSPHSQGPEVPIATSSPHAGAAGLIISQLPPSDPPNPTMTTNYEEDHSGHWGLPPIESIHEPDPEPDARSSSPWSMFGEHEDDSRANKKRKRPQVDVSNAHDIEVDELAPSPIQPPCVEGSAYGNGYLYPTTHVDAGDMLPPPTFFAGSSSSSMGGRDKGKKQLSVPPSNLDAQSDILDLTDLPCTLDTGAVPSTAKPKKPKKKKLIDDADFDYDQPAPMHVFDEDDADGDFDPTGDGGGKKKKGKAKAKEGVREKKETVKEKKAREKKEKESLKEKSRVEVVIPYKTKAVPGKTKGKGKESLNDRDTFKSNEFVLDSDEDDSGQAGADPLLLVGETSHETTSATATYIAAASSSHSKRPTPIPATSSSHIPTSSPSASKAFGTKERGVDLDMPKAKAKSKKRKSIVDSDAEEQEDIVRKAPVGDVDSIVVKRQKKAKAKNVVSDEEDEDGAYEMQEEVMLKKTNRKASGKDKGKAKEPGQKARKASKVVLSDEEDAATGGGDAYMDEQPDAQEDQPSPEDKGTRKTAKENIVPTPAPLPVSRSVIATPRPQASISRASSVRPDGTTPLYARYEVAPRRSSLPMSELIRRASSKPNSPFPAGTGTTPAARSKAATAAPSTPMSTPSVSTYSPYLKSSRRMLSRIAPLHPNRRTPPPPPPPPPPRKKSKKELEMEEKWEEELVESVGGVEVWAAMEEGERKDMRRVKREVEMGGWDE